MSRAPGSEPSRRSVVPGDLAGEHLAQVQLQRLLEQRDDLRREHARDRAEALGELALAQPRFERHAHRGLAHHDRGLAEAAAQHARDREHVVLGHALVQERGGQLRALEVGLAEDPVVGGDAGRPIARRSCVMTLEVDARCLGDLARRVARLPADVALGGHRDSSAGSWPRRRSTGDADVVVEVVEQLDALAALVLVEPLEQALCFPVGHGGAETYAGGVRSRAENHEHMIVLGIDPGLANTGYGVVARRGGRLVALDGGCIETPPRHGRPSGASP